MVIDEDRAARRIVEAGQQGEQRRLAAADGTDEAELLTRFEAKQHVLQRRTTGAREGEREVLDAQPALQGGCGAGGVLRLDFEEFGDTGAGSVGARQLASVQPRISSGNVMSARYPVNWNNCPTVICPAMTCCPPTASTESNTTPLVECDIAWNSDRRRASRRLASR